MAPKPFSMTSTKCPGGAWRSRSMWNDGGGGNPRCTIIPSPSPVAPWQGEQKIPNRCSPRSRTARVTAKGKASAADAARPSPGESLGTVSSTSGREARPSAKNELDASGLYRGWSPMSLRQAVQREQAEDREERSAEDRQLECDRNEGRPAVQGAAFIPITFELSILG